MPDVIAPPRSGGRHDLVRRVEVVGLLTEAADTLRRLPWDGPARIRSSMPAPLRERADVWAQAVEAGRWEAMTARDGPPTGEAIGRLDLLLAAMVGLDQPTRSVLWGRAFGLPWRTIQRQIGGVSRMTAWRTWVEGLLLVGQRLR